MKYFVVLFLFILSTEAAKINIENIDFISSQIKNLVNLYVGSTQRLVKRISDKFQCFPKPLNVSTQLNENIQEVFQCMAIAAANASEKIAPLAEEFNSNIEKLGNNTISVLEDGLKCFKLNILNIKCFKELTESVIKYLSTVGVSSWKVLVDLLNAWQQYVLDNTQCVAKATSDNLNLAFGLQLEFLNCIP